jgi:hypothetical protein
MGLAAASVSLAVATAHAQVVTDGSPGPATALPGPIFVIQSRAWPDARREPVSQPQHVQLSQFRGTPGLVNIIARVAQDAPVVHPCSK